MIKIKQVTAYYGSDYEMGINEAISEQTKRGCKFIDIKHSVAANSSGKLYSALLMFDDSPITDIPTSLNQ